MKTHRVLTMPFAAVAIALILMTFAGEIKRIPASALTVKTGTRTQVESIGALGGYIPIPYGVCADALARLSRIGKKKPIYAAGHNDPALGF